jgi:hypothetical protein
MCLLNLPIHHWCGSVIPIECVVAGVQSISAIRDEFSLDFVVISHGPATHAFFLFVD